MQPRSTLANQRIEKFLEWENNKKKGHSDSSAIYPSLHNRYIAFIQNTAIIKEGIFLEELSVLKRENCFCLLFTVCHFMFSVRLNFVGQSVLYSTAYLSDCHQNYLT